MKSSVKKTAIKSRRSVNSPAPAADSFGPKKEITGKVEYHRNFESEQLRQNRDIIVWLPPDYDTSRKKRYPVLYMHDGQNIMDPATSYIGVDWRVDEWAERLILQKKMEPCIIVGINNTRDRLNEYSDSPTGLHYRLFIIEELKKFIDREYRTLPDRENTAAMGSSMGGLCSMLLAWNHSEVFSRAACLSSSFYYSNDKIFKLIHFADDKPKIRIYIDSGEDGKRDAQKMFVLLSQRGFVIGDDLDYYYAKGEHHTESAWANRLERPLTFLFPAKQHAP